MLYTLCFFFYLTCLLACLLSRLLIHQVPYTPGVLMAVGLQGGQVVANKTLTTAGAPARLRMTPDRAAIAADRGDLSYVLVEVH